MSPEVQSIFWGIALILFLIEGLGDGRGRVNFLALGLAFWVVPWFWSVVDAGW